MWNTIAFYAGTLLFAVLLIFIVGLVFGLRMPLMGKWRKNRKQP